MYTKLWATSQSCWPLLIIHISNYNGSFRFYVAFFLPLWPSRIVFDLTICIYIYVLYVNNNKWCLISPQWQMPYHKFSFFLFCVGGVVTWSNVLKVFLCLFWMIYYSLCVYFGWFIIVCVFILDDLL